MKYRPRSTIFTQLVIMLYVQRLILPTISWSENCVKQWTSINFSFVTLWQMKKWNETIPRNLNTSIWNVGYFYFCCCSPVNFAMQSYYYYSAAILKMPIGRVEFNKIFSPLPFPCHISSAYRCHLSMPAQVRTAHCEWYCINIRKVPPNADRAAWGWLQQNTFSVWT